MKQLKNLTIDDLRQLKLCTILDLFEVENLIRQKFRDSNNKELAAIVKAAQTKKFQEEILIIDDMITKKSLLQ